MQSSSSDCLVDSNCTSSSAIIVDNNLWGWGRRWFSLPGKEGVLKEKQEMCTWTCFVFGSPNLWENTDQFATGSGLQSTFHEYNKHLRWTTYEEKRFIATHSLGESVPDQVVMSLVCHLVIQFWLVELPVASEQPMVRSISLCKAIRIQPLEKSSQQSNPSQSLPKDFTVIGSSSHPLYTLNTSLYRRPSGDIEILCKL